MNPCPTSFEMNETIWWDTCRDELLIWFGDSTKARFHRVVHTNDYPDAIRRWGWTWSDLMCFRQKLSSEWQTINILLNKETSVWGSSPAFSHRVPWSSPACTPYTTRLPPTAGSPLPLAKWTKAAHNFAAKFFQVLGGVLSDRINRNRHKDIQLHLKLFFWCLTPFKM